MKNASSRVVLLTLTCLIFIPTSFLLAADRAPTVQTQDTGSNTGAQPVPLPTAPLQAESPDARGTLAATSPQQPGSQSANPGVAAGARLTFEDHEAFIPIVLITLLSGAFTTYIRNQRDWCGYRLIPNIILQQFFVVLLMALVYYKFLLGLAAIPLPLYVRQLIGFVLAFFAPYLTFELVRRMVPKSKKRDKHPSLFDLPVELQIARKKISVVNELEKCANLSTLLSNAISSSRLDRREKGTLLKKVAGSPTRADIFDVMDKVGLKILKTMVPGK